MDFFVYFVCLGVGVVFTLCTAVFGHLFGGHHDGLSGSHGHAEAGVDSSDMPGMSVFSPTIIAVFITAFGGIGLLLTQIPATKNPYISAPLAALGACIVAGSVLFMLRQMFQKTQSSSEAKVSDLVGLEATVITPIPENGVGEIAYVLTGTRYTAPARSENGAPIANGRSVHIARANGPQFVVKPV
ncbi:MAG: NfeD family protein [Verrucomicrobia bacterium]|nr:NfeD family protein [Verrucomicrobiota bacterium]